MLEMNKGTVITKTRRISLREKFFVGIGSIVAVLILSYFLVISPLIEKTRVLDRLLLQKENEINEINRLKNDYILLKSKISLDEESLSRQKDGFSLLSFLEGVATKDEIRKNIIYMRPQNISTVEDYRVISVEVKIDEVRLSQIVKFISAIENSPYLLRIKRIHMKTRYSDPQFLDTTIFISTFEKI